MVVTLRPHQSKVVRDVKKENCRGLLIVHGLGSGKTFTAIATAEALPIRSRILVAVPAKLRTNMKGAIQQFGVKKKYRVVSYTQIANDLKKGKTIDEKVLIIDEVHNLRNTANLASTALMGTKFEKIIMLTATPMVNTPADLLFPARMLKARGMPVAKDLERIPLKHNIKEATRNALVDKVSVYLPQNPAGFPKQRNHTVTVRFSPDQFVNYMYILKRSPGIRLAMPKDANDIPVPSSKDLAFLGKVRQLSNVVSYWEKNPSVYIPQTPKLQRLCEALDTGPLPAVIYSNYIGMGLRPIQWALEHPKEMGMRKRIRFAVVEGKTTDKMLRDYVQRYNTKKLDALLISGAGGEGLDLKRTRQMHLMEQYWHQTRMHQVAGRGVRYLSHEDLPVDERVVDVFSYVGVYPSSFSIFSSNKSLLSRAWGFISTMFTRAPGFTADQYLYELANRKAKAVAAYIDILRYDSIECREDKAFCGSRTAGREARHLFNLPRIKPGELDTDTTLDEVMKRPPES